MVTAVGYDNTPGVGLFGLGTVTISDPWTHATNPPLPPGPSASHTDGLLPPWQGKPDHNTSPNHGALPATEPYNLCDVTQIAPLKMQCYNEDTGAPELWSVVDMIAVSPLPVGGIAEVDASEASPAGTGGSAGTFAVVAGILAAVAVAGGGGFYARRRWLR